LEKSRCTGRACSDFDLPKANSGAGAQYLPPLLPSEAGQGDLLRERAAGRREERSDGSGAATHRRFSFGSRRLTKPTSHQHVRQILGRILHSLRVEGFRENIPLVAPDH
jgi:hypothetical protein